MGLIFTVFICEEKSWLLSRDRESKSNVFSLFFLIKQLVVNSKKIGGSAAGKQKELSDAIVLFSFCDRGRGRAVQAKLTQRCGGWGKEKLGYLQKDTTKRCTKGKMPFSMN